MLTNYFQALKIYNQGLKIYNQGLKIYFQVLKIISKHGVKDLMERCRGFVCLMFGLSWRGNQALKAR